MTKLYLAAQIIYFKVFFHCCKIMVFALSYLLYFSQRN